MKKKRLLTSEISKRKLYIKSIVFKNECIWTNEKALTFLKFMLNKMFLAARVGRCLIGAALAENVLWPFNCSGSLSWGSFSFLGLGGLHDESLVDVWDDTTTSNGCFDQSVELFVSSDGKLEMSWCNSLDLEIFGSVTSKLKNLSSEVLKDGSTVDCWCSTNSAVGTDSALQESVDSSNREL